MVNTGGASELPCRLTFKKDEEIQVLVQCLQQVHVVIRNLPLGRIAVPEGLMEKTEVGRGPHREQLRSAR